MAVALSHLNQILPFLVLILLLSPNDADDPTCVFDSVRPVDPTIASDVTYKPAIEDYRKRRRATLKPLYNDLFKPIRLTPYFSSTITLDTDQMARLRGVISHVIGIASEIFSVIPVQGQLLLGRSACNQVWQSGVNAGKCASLRPRSTSRSCSTYPEYCTSSKEFQIPVDHLSSLSLWLNSSSVHSEVLICSAGLGISDTDFILYINSQQTNTCLEQGLNVIAYATYCQLDPNGRPIAGYINICPQMFTDANYNVDRIAVTALHELFHALGFSVDLVNRFKKCSLAGFSGSIVSCTNQANPLKLVNSVTRLMSDKVVQLTSDHFSSRNLTTTVADNFGPVLQTVLGVVMSHWDAAFMQSSLMTPSISLPTLMLLDNITLAFFEDTGWYTVNYNYTDTFFWGRGMGSNFGLNPYCSEKPDGEYFCQQSASGCHYLRTYKGTCQTNQLLHGCYVYIASQQDSCEVSTGGIANDSSGEIYNANSRCFISNLSPFVSMPSNVPPTGRCYETLCDTDGLLYIRLNLNNNNTGWIACPPSATITVPGFVGQLICPSADILCTTRAINYSVSLLPPPTVTTTPHTTPTMQHKTPSPPPPVYLEIYFNSLPVSLLITSAQVDAFTASIVKMTSRVTGVTRHRLHSVTLLIDDNSVAFVMTPATSTADGPDSDVAISVLTEFISGGSFKINITGSGNDAPTTVTANALQQVSTISDDDDDANVASVYSNSSGPAITASVCAIIGVIIIAVATWYVVKRFRRRPSSEDERTDQQGRAV